MLADEKLERRTGWWTVAGEDGREPAYYFAPAERASGPYTQQRIVQALIDIADDGTLAGIELLDGMPPPPKAAKR